MVLGPLMVGVAGTSLTADERDRLAQPGVGGVLLFARNYQDPDQVRDLVASIHALRTPPLLVAVDQEGGRVQRLRDGFTRLPPLRAFGHWYDSDADEALQGTYWCAWLMAVELRAVGVDFSFAPVLDLDQGVSEVIGDRGLHSDPGAAGVLGAAWHRGVEAAGMATVGKHFPGHGGCAADSHIAYPRDERGLAELERCDLVPFRYAIESGLTAIMPAHVLFPAISADPVGFSPWWIWDYLRRRLGFRGPIISDDLGMRAADTAGDLRARAVACLDAGCDMAILANEGAAVDTILSGLRASDTDSAVRLERLRPAAPADAREPLATASASQARCWIERAHTFVAGRQA